MNRFLPAFTLLAAGALLWGALPAGAEETWKSLGKGYYRENALHTNYQFSYYPEIEVEIEESEQTPGRYRVVNPYKDYPSEYVGNNSPGCMDGDYYVVIDASDPEHVYMEPSCTGYIIGQGTNDDGEPELLVLWSSSIAYDYYKKYHNWVRAENENRLGAIRDGYINFTAGKLIDSNMFISDVKAGVVPDDSGEFLWRIAPDDMFRVRLPGAPKVQDSSVDFIGIDDALTTLSYNVWLDTDVESARVAIFEGDFSDEMIKAIEEGTVDYKEIKSSGKVDFPYTADGVFTVVVVPYWDGHTTFEKYVTNEMAYDQSEWRKVGTATYTEAIMSSNDLTAWGQFVYDEMKYPVEVEENNNRPGYFRMVDPYGPNYPYYREDDYDHSRHWYVYIDATDREHVVIEYCPEVGADLGAGKMELWSRADYYSKEIGMTHEEIEDRGLYGTHLDNSILFGPETLLIRFAPNPETWYWANISGHFCLEFAPGQVKGGEFSGVATIGEENAPAEYYTLDGRKITSGDLMPGIYVVRAGNKVTKQIVK